MVDCKMLTEQEKYAQSSTGLVKCEKCQRSERNWRGYRICKDYPGMSPKRCGDKFKLDEKIVKLMAERAFK